MPKMHKHRAKTTRIRAFSGPVAIERQNLAAHGNVCEIATCACGAERHTNRNRRHVERGPWHKGSP